MRENQQKKLQKNCYKKQEIFDSMETDIVNNGLNKQQREDYMSTMNSLKTLKTLRLLVKFSLIWEFVNNHKLIESTKT